MIRSYNNYVAMIDTLTELGIPWSMNHQLKKEKWQKLVDQVNCNITSLGCMGVVVGDTTFVFSVGRPDWTKDLEYGEGQDGSFLFSYNEKTEEFIKRDKPFNP